jgi:DNA (cytosine-5)-methyltransferase 1
LGWRPAFFAEIDPFPSAVLAKHYPAIPNLGDMAKINGDDWRGKIDLLVGGTPCQAFSVAGLRKSLGDERGNLVLKFMELADAIDPTWIVWENVPGVLSTRDNAFGCLLGGLAGEDGPLLPPGKKWTDAGVVFGPTRTVAWRVLDAQYFGLAQRRRRVFVVAGARNCADPVAVLFERKSLRRDSPPSREARQDIAPTISARAQGGGGLGTDFDLGGGLITEAFGGNNISGPIDVATALNACSSASGRMDFDSETFITHSLRGEGFDASEDGTGRGTPLATVAIPIQEAGARTGISTTDPRAGIGIGGDGDPMFTLQAGKQHAVAFNLRGRTGGAQVESDPDDLASLRAANGGSSRSYVAFDCKAGLGFQGFEADGVTPTLRAMNANGRENAGGQLAVQFEMAVRRLTPRECERLQGFPDDYVKISWRSKPPEVCPDGHRYRALGNSMAVPVMAWIGRRIQEVYRKN